MVTRFRTAPLCAALAVLGCLACGDDGRLPTEPAAAELPANTTPNACETDVTPPSISSVSASRTLLWAPNHKLIPITITVAASDNCSAVTSRIVGVTSNEPENGLGDGNTAPDWAIMGPLTLLLRSERSGPGTGRVYTVTVAASDAANNTSTGTTTVVVPHDQRQ